MTRLGGIATIALAAGLFASSYAVGHSGSGGMAAAEESPVPPGVSALESAAVPEWPARLTRPAEMPALAGSKVKAAPKPKPAPAPADESPKPKAPKAASPAPDVTQSPAPATPSPAPAPAPKPAPAPRRPAPSGGGFDDSG